MRTLASTLDRAAYCTVGNKSLPSRRLPACKSERLWPDEPLGSFHLSESCLPTQNQGICVWILVVLLVNTVSVLGQLHGLSDLDPSFDDSIYSPPLPSPFNEA